MISFISSVSYGEALTQLKECSFCTILYGTGYSQCDCDKKPQKRQTQVTGKKRKVSSLAKTKKLPNCAKCVAAGKVRQYCKECGGSAYCTHGKQKSRCKECGGSGLCTHGVRKTYCKECGGSAFCIHGREKKRCKECGGSALCTHGIRKTICKECGGSALCTHEKQKRYCKICKVPCPHAEKLYKCKEGCYESWAQKKLREGSAASAAI